MLALLLSGKSTQRIAKDLFVSENTVRTHLPNIYHKLDVPNRRVLMALYLGKAADVASRAAQREKG